ncbi:sugar ABC transporter permease [Clostridium sp. AF19-22AC]|jgi:D-xylose transport system permease protein|uniref:Xylose transport system permease protein XylH n=1 Tax=Faecalicatena orotica TaxID=1544 RepID=A0A2Y9BHQ1_9FIRM|nr:MULTISPECIES: sugar ABC transporter permease [Clostridia]PWJ28599.1 xylose ABC transporter membrane protein [Faecalicatena orotica]RHR31286.1 sugar ABC transporter permease [Clostridium sp. AF19-22AC]SSA56420.1 xylose ABC transporter membrane protein [Faecalicatena orotica]
MREKRANITGVLYKNSLLIELIIIFALFSFLTNGTFISTRNLSNLMMQGVTCSIIAITMTLVIVSCNCDLSAGTALGCMGTIAAVIQVKAGFGTAATLLVVAACSLVLGLWHGFWIAYKKLPAFIVTLATQLVLKGIILAVGNGASIGPMSDSFSKFGSSYLPNLGESSVHITSLVIALAGCVIFIVISVRGEKRKIQQGLIEANWNKKIIKIVIVVAAIFVVSGIFIFYKGFPYAIVVLTALAAVFHYVVNNTVFGRYVFAVGGNAEAAKLSGIKTEKINMQIYMLHSLIVGVASVIYLGRVGQATPTAGTSFEFTAITGCVVGGTSILGGRGTIVGAVIGTMLMASLDNGMSLLNMGQSSQYIVKGLVLMLAIAMDVISRSKRG